MQLHSQKTVRFSELVKDFGQPEQVTLWTAPEDDPEFSKAIREQRVVTVIQRNATSRKDYGLVGFYQEALATFLVFPKRITFPAETKVIGIKYDQLKKSAPQGGVFRPKVVSPPSAKTRSKPLSRKTQAAKTKPEPAKEIVPPRYKFVSKLEIAAKQTIELEVEATTSRQAAELLETAAAERTLDPAAARITRKLGKPHRRVAAA